MPTVADRVAQTVVARVIEAGAEPVFHRDSFGYRPGRSALDAVAACRRRCWKADWVIDLDIRKFFDTMPWDLAVKAVQAVTGLPWVVLYVRRWLAAPLALPDGTLQQRDRGTPQGSAVTPPTQWATRRLVTLRVRCLVFLVAVAGSLADGDAVPDGDLLRADKDVFDEEPQDALALWDTGATGAGSQLGEESFQVIGELEVGLLIGKLGVQGIELATQVGLAGTQVRHPGPQLVNGDQLLLERLDHAGDRGRGFGQGEFQPFALPGGRIGGAGLLQAFADLGADRNLSIPLRHWWLNSSVVSPPSRWLRGAG